MCSGCFSCIYNIRFYSVIKFISVECVYLFNDENSVYQMNYETTRTKTGAFFSFAFLFGESRDSIIHLGVFAVIRQQQGQVHSGLAVRFLTWPIDLTFSQHLTINERLFLTYEYQDRTIQFSSATEAKIETKPRTRLIQLYHRIQGNIDKYRVDVSYS